MWQGGLAEQSTKMEPPTAGIDLLAQIDCEGCQCVVSSSKREADGAFCVNVVSMDTACWWWW